MTSDPQTAVRSAPAVELLYTRDCVHLGATRSLLASCIAELGVDVTVVEREGTYHSPTVLVNGVDVMGDPCAESAACRLDLPTRQQVLEALTP